MAVRVRAVIKIDDSLLKEAERIAPRVMRKALIKSADHALARIKGRGPQPAPIRSGRLRREYEKKVSHRSLRVLITNRRTFYAGFVEFGTRKMSAQPHFRPAIKAARKMVRREANKTLIKEFSKL